MRGLNGGSPAPASDAPAKIDGARAAGGPVQAGKNFLVGEGGPEIFQPTQSGTILPNGVGGGAPSVTINATFSMPITINGGGDGNLARQVQAAAKQAVDQAVAVLDQKLSRSMDTTFGNIRYGDA